VKIGYGTYGMPETPIQDALPRLASMGYEAVELCVADRWPTSPHKLSPDERQQLCELLRETKLELSALLIFVNLLAPAGEELDAELALFEDACLLAQDLCPGSPVPIVTTLGSSPYQWKDARSLVLARAQRFAGLAENHGCRLALEPHVNALLDRPERVLETMEAVGSPALGINFDISHFVAQGFPSSETIRALAPHALHTHVKDGRTVDDRVQFLLPGEGGFDYAAYFREMAETGYRGAVTAEVSVQVSSQPAYDPWRAAEFCFRTLKSARDEASGSNSSSNSNS
jgi:sugar phosphate isomerase/epimerase